MADTISHMINIDPQVQPELEPEGHEFGYYTFYPLPALEVHDIQTSPTESTQDDYINEFLGELPIDDNMLAKLQQKDEFCKNIFQQIEKGNLLNGQLYKIDNKILKRLIIDGNNTYETTIIPRSLIPQILRMAHDKLGHNGAHRTYILLKRLYYWKGLKLSVKNMLRDVINVKEEINKL